MSRNRYIIPAIFVVVPLALQTIPAISHAETVVATTVAPDPEPQTVEAKFIHDLGQRAMAILGNANLTASQIDARMHELFNGAFDIEKVGQFAIGTGAWTTLTSPQRQEYLRLFKEFVLRNYGARLGVYHGETFQVKKVRPREQTTIVSTEIAGDYSGQPSTHIDWVVRNNKGKCAIVDVVIDGVSQSVTQRDQLSSILSQNGGDFNALLAALHERAMQTAATTDSASSALPVGP